MRQHRELRSERASINTFAGPRCSEASMASHWQAKHGVLRPRASPSTPCWAQRCWRCAWGCHARGARARSMCCARHPCAAAPTPPVSPASAACHCSARGQPQRQRSRYSAAALWGRGGRGGARGRGAGAVGATRRAACVWPRAQRRKVLIGPTTWLGPQTARRGAAGARARAQGRAADDALGSARRS